MNKSFIATIAFTGLLAVVPAHAQSNTNAFGIYRGNVNHVLSLPYQRVRRAEDSLQNFRPRIYDDGVVRVQDNTRRGGTNITNARLIPNNYRQIRSGSRYPHTRYTQIPYRRQTVISLPHDTYCDWVTYFEKYHDGIGWVDYERIVPECDKADGYIRYFAKDPKRSARFTSSSYNQYDSYRWSDGVQEFQNYGW